MDSQRINNLIEYLEELHEHNKATVDHTTLLLNCYAKLKDTKKLETFIKSGTNFDLDTAIGMCRQGGYYDQAVFLAKKNNEHELVVDILIENSKNYDEALDYIWRLEPEAAYPNLMKYARVLLEHCPKDTTQIFIDYYTGQYRPKRDIPQPVQPAPQFGAAAAVQNLASFIPLPYRQSPGILSPPTQGNAQTMLSDADAAAAEALGPPREYDLPRPRTAFSAFIDHSNQFIIFLEACFGQEGIDKTDKTDLCTALFEIYLETANIKKGDEKREWEAKAKALVDGKDVTMTKPIRTTARLISSRPQLIHRTSYYSRTCRIFATALCSFKSNKGFVPIYSDRILRQTILSVPSKRCESMDRKSRSCILQRWHTSPLAHRSSKKPVTSWGSC